MLDDGTKYELDLGGKTPVQTGTYAKKSDAPDIYVIADQFQTDLERLVADPNEPPTPRPRRPVPPTPAPSDVSAPAGRRAHARTPHARDTRSLDRASTTTLAK